MVGQFDNKSVYRNTVIEQWEDLQHSPRFETVQKPVEIKEARPVYSYLDLPNVNRRRNIKIRSKLLFVEWPCSL